MISGASMDPVVIIDAKSSIKSVNREFLRLFGYKRWEVIGKSVTMLMLEKFAKHHEKLVQRYMKSKMRRIIGEKRDNIVALRKDRSEVPVVLKVSELIAGNDLAFIGIVKNVTYDQELQRIKDMIANMLPQSVASKIQNGVSDIAEDVEGSVVFIDLVGFNEFMAKNPAKRIVADLNHIFKIMDSYCDKYECEKIKTIGDCYMAICTSTKGETSVFDYAIRIIEMALEIIAHIQAETKFDIRAGIATGSMVQGVLSGKKLAFDVWGEVVNLSSRLQSLADKSTILVCSRTYKESNFKYIFSQSKTLNVKGKGEVDTYMLDPKKSIVK